jgi:hypothetical protein
MSNSQIINIDNRIGAILQSKGQDRSVLLLDEYRTSNIDQKETFLLVLMTRIVLEHDLRLLGNGCAK